MKVAGVVCLLVALAIRPRFARLPARAVSRDRLPALARLVDRVAEALGARSVDYFQIGEMLNASIQRTGARQRTLLTLGLPLWAVLDGRERTALLAHELAHRVNGDISRGMAVGSAVLPSPAAPCGGSDSYARGGGRLHLARARFGQIGQR